MLEDIAVLTGATVISEDLGYELKETTVDMLGSAGTVKVDKENTVIVNGAGKAEDIADRVAQIRETDRNNELRIRQRKDTGKTG